MLTSSKRVITVGIAEMEVSDDPDATLVTYSLGSCLGVMIYDPVVHVGGLLHIMLPEANAEKSSKGFNPLKYVDTGVPMLFKEAYKYGAQKNRMKVSVAGGAQILDDSGFFNIGKRNMATLRKLFWKNGVMIEKEHVEGTVSRTVRLHLNDGKITIKLGWGEEIVL
ncbi:MAG: chemotaxis protein CheD [Candidatus Latescibacteria bacterium]|nr:chemotaxis protein CheD [Candidatus Latescibacterota bacterium]